MRYRSIAGATILLLMFVVLVCISVGFVLSWTAGLPTRADGVVVLGGGPIDGARYAHGRQLVLNGYSRQMLLINQSDPVRNEAKGRLTGVNVHFDNLPRNTLQEAQAMRVWMVTHGLKTVVIVSDPPHMLRVKYAFFSSFSGTGLAYTLVATNPNWWNTRRWWTNAVSFDFVRSEVGKMGYYLLQYRFGLF